MEFKNQWQNYQKLFERHMYRALPEHLPKAAAKTSLNQAIDYSLSSGGKRFRPVLCLAIADTLDSSIEKALDFALSVEMIHSYSLIHDDLPCMDDDDLRRGKPTTHIKFGEATALLAGDALLTEAFSRLAKGYGNEPYFNRLVEELSLAAGAKGMVGGQALDMLAQREDLSLSEIENLHRMKTGALIRVSARGAATIAGATVDQMRAVTSSAESIGLAFQIADDLLDYDPANIEPGSFPALLGEAGAQERLAQVTNESISSLEAMDLDCEFLVGLCRYNQTRQK
jgi:geranylgeranyl diphosphate synthase type II